MRLRALHVRRRSSGAEREREETLRDLVDGATDLIQTVAPDGTVIYTNRAWRETLGYGEEDLARLSIWEVVHPESRSHFVEAFQQVLEGRSLQGVEAVFLTREGRLVYLEGNLSCRLENGKPVSTRGFFRDVTGRREAEERLSAAETKYRTLVEQLPLAVYIDRADANSSNLYSSPQIEPMLGYSPEEWVADPGLFVKLLHPDDRARVLAEHARSNETGERFRSEYRLIARDGRTVWCLDEAVVVRDENGRPLFAQGYLADISEQKRAESELREQTEFVRLLQEVAVAANESSSVEEALRGCLDRICAHTGWPVGHVYLRRGEAEDRLAPSTIWHLSDPERFESFTRLTEATYLAPGEGLPGRVLAAGKPVWIPDVSVDPNFPRAPAARESGLKAAFAFPVLVGAEIEAVLEFFSADALEPDPRLLEVMSHVGTQLGRVIERERARAEAEAARHELAEQNERLLEVDRLKDEFISLVSHELRTPLTSIQGYLELLLAEETEELTPEQHRFLTVVRRNSERLLNLVGDLLLLAQLEAGQLTLERRNVDLAALASECVESALPGASEKGITISLDRAPVPAVAGDVARLAQVLDNLVSNALKFTPEGGRVELTLSTSNGNVVFEVADTGVGIPADERERVFERFFRSSSASAHAIPGTGLGLAIAKAIVDRHDGRITVESEEGAGTTFRIELPAGSPSAADLEREEVAA